MKLVIRTLVFHLLCIIFFSFVYYNLRESFDDIRFDKKNKTFFDYFLLSVTIQSGVGLTYLDPIAFYSKIMTMIQQLLLISTHVITLYIFTL
jgi:hypothetical protein